MKYLGIFASGLLLLGGLTGAGAQGMYDYGGEWKLGVGGLTSASQRDAFHMGYGVDGIVAYERAFGQTDSRVGVRGGFVDYQRDESEFDIPDNFQEYNVALEALAGPALASFEPKAGGHVGYIRQDGAGSIGDEDALDVGFDAMAGFEFNKNVGLHALITPLWIITDDDTDYQTRGALNVEFIIPGV